MTWIFLAPHFDDVALSCGGFVWEKAQQADKVSIWTICGGEPLPGALSAFAESLHSRWETPAEAVQQRRLEDQVSCQAMETEYRYFSLPDCIYRPGGAEGTYYYASEEAIFGTLHLGEYWLVDALAQELQAALPRAVQVVCPLTLGGHVDHRLTRAAAEKLGVPLWYYPDYPYVIESADPLRPFREAGWTSQVFPISEPGLNAWQAAVAAHQSQISTFWTDLGGMQAAIRTYCQIDGGVRLWKSV